MFKRGFRRLRAFMQAEMMTELAGARAEIGAARAEVAAVHAELAAARAEMAVMRVEMARRDELAPLVRQMEAALLTIALGGEAGSFRGRELPRHSRAAEADF